MLTKIKSDLALPLSEISGLSASEIVGLLEVPKNSLHGELALPVFQLAKVQKKAPPLIAKEISEKLNQKKLKNLVIAEAVAGFVNIKFQMSYLQESLSDALAKKNVGFNSTYRGKKFVIDYSSPNVAKPMSIGHLRATVIGQAIRNLAQSQGYEIIGINHLGDWGIQFGKLAWAFTNWRHEYPFAERPFDSLYQIYVRFHEEAEKNPSLDEEGAKYFRRLEAGDPEIEKIWRLFLEISLKEYDRIYKLLNVKHELVQGEAFYKDQLAPTVEKIKKAGILEESEGAQVVFVGENMPPCLITKSDGSSLYATRDIASAIYRHDILKGDEIVYVVGVDQTLHFQQVFKVLERMGYEWSKNCRHIAFGMYRFKEIGRMSTRKGNVIFMDDVLSKSMEIVKTLIEEKNPDLSTEEKNTIIRQVGVGAIIFNDLMNDRVKNVDFDWERVLDFEGDSGPYVQYGHVRCKSLVRKYAQPVPKTFARDLPSEEERQLVAILLRYDEILTAAFRTYRPNIVAQYLLDLCRSFSSFYQKHRVLEGDLDLQKARMTLVQSTAEVISAALGILGIESPQVM